MSPALLRDEGREDRCAPAPAAGERPAVDVIIVLYNSARHIDRLVASLAALEYPRDRMRTIFVDNASEDDGASGAESAAAAAGLDFMVVRNAKNVGFGAGINAGVRAGNAPYLFVLNPDTEVAPDSVGILVDSIRRRPDAAIVEARQVPIEHPKLYDPVTLETSWASGAAFLIARQDFLAVGGFDEALFLYCEDVDLSWRLRAIGRRIYYEPRAVVRHETYAFAEEVKSLQSYFGVLHNLFLRWRYGSWMTILSGYLRLFGAVLRPRRERAHRARLLRAFAASWPLVAAARRGRGALRRSRVASFLGWDYEWARPGVTEAIEPIAEHPLVSVVVRTHHRPAFLREALRSIANQTYRPIEVVVAEDGSKEGEAVCGEFMGDLRVAYVRAPVGSGRSRTANLGVTTTQGEYVCFLDDDDVLYADHVETLVSTIQATRLRVAYALAIEAEQVVDSLDPLRYRILRRRVVHDQAFDRLALLHHNYLPIQAVLVARPLFALVGGFDETLDALEDWDFWLRLVIAGEEFGFVRRATSEYRIRVDDRAAATRRQRALDEAYTVVTARHARAPVPLSVRELSRIGPALHRIEGLDQFRAHPWRFLMRKVRGARSGKR